MKRILKVAAIILAALLMFTSCASTGGARPKNTEMSILFIGNSFTYGNNLPWLFNNICESAGYKNVKADSVMAGSYTLEMFCDPEDKYCQEIDRKFAENKYDIVIIQEQSIRPINKYDKFHDAAKILTDKAKANGARVLLYQTWGYAEGFPDLRYNNLTTDQMAYQLADAYTRLGEELGAEVVYCGLVMLDVYNQGTDIPLYHADLKHPGMGGSFLVALTFYNYILGADTTKVPYKPNALTEEQADLLKQEVMTYFSEPVTWPQS
jgi:hypothetical protein